MKHKSVIEVVGLGPGHPDYILPAALNCIEAATVIIGAPRLLLSVAVRDKRVIKIDHNLAEILSYIKVHSITEKIVVIVSGDTGFYSLLRYLKKNLSDIDIRAIPGLSSISYMFARLGMTWDDARLGSVHGRSLDIVAVVSNYDKVALLTDQIWTPAAIATELYKAGLERIVYVGERLSYSDERISTLTVQEAMQYQADSLSVVVIENV